MLSRIAIPKRLRARVSRAFYESETICRMAQVMVSETIVIRASPERVWDYTQNYSIRSAWDRAIVSAEVLGGPTPVPRVRVTLRNAGQCTYQYKLFARPRRTTLAMEDVKSWMFLGGGGSWAYDPEADGTRWTQTNTVVLRSHLAGPFLAPVVRWQLRRMTRQGMRTAKRLIEGSEGA